MSVVNGLVAVALLVICNALENESLHFLVLDFI